MPCIVAAVGKSGAGMTEISSVISKSGLSINNNNPSITSLRLWGGILVAIPTAIPDDPLMSRFGILVGKTEGSDSDSS